MGRNQVAGPLRRLPALPADERGSVTAEFALVLPAVVLMLTLILVAVSAGTQQIMLQNATAQAARLLGRGEPAQIAERSVYAVAPMAGIGVDYRADMVCVTGTSIVLVGSVWQIPVQARSCSLTGGR